MIARPKIILALMALLMLADVAPVSAEFPEKPIVIVVHSKPGGAIDRTARMVAKIARTYTDASLVVENRYGGSGAVAMRYVLHKPADGYTVLGFPATFVSTVKITQSNFGMDDFDFVACLTLAPEVIISNRNASVTSFEEIVADAKAKDGRQIWVGPGVGGLDHLMAVKTWGQMGIPATWIPYDGGGEAISALLGEHGIVYVGNPEDVLGRPDLFIAATATDERLPRHPDSPTFRELGIDLSGDTMWRGFALRQGVPPEPRAWLEDILRQVGEDEEWLEFVDNNSAEAVLLTGTEFRELVDRESLQSEKYLKVAGILAEEDSAGIGVFHALLLLLAPVLLGLVIQMIRRRGITGELVIVLVCMGVALLFFVMSLRFPAPHPGQVVGSASIPRIWSGLLGFFSLLLAIGQLRAGTGQGPRNGRVGQVLLISLLMLIYVTALDRIGFFPSTLFMLAGGIYLLGYRKHLMAWIVVASVLAFSYLVFIRALGLPLPMGNLF